MDTSNYNDIIVEVVDGIGMIKVPQSPPSDIRIQESNLYAVQPAKTAQLVRRHFDRRGGRRVETIG